MGPMEIPGYDVDGAAEVGPQTWRARRRADGRTVLLHGVSPVAEAERLDEVRRVLARVGGLAAPSLLPLQTVVTTEAGLALVVAYLAEGGTGGLGQIGARAIAGNQGDRLWAAILSMAILGTVGLVLLSVLQRAVMGWHVSQRPQRD